MRYPYMTESGQCIVRAPGIRNFVYGKIVIFVSENFDYGQRVRV